MVEDVEARIDGLYALPLDRFTAERDALAKELAAGGDREGSNRVKALRKPLAPAWALNAWARAEPERVRELLELGRRLRAAHARAVAGRNVEPFREAAEERRRLVSALARDTGEHLGGASAAQADAIAGTLEAATVDEETGELLRRGRLVTPVRPPSILPQGGLRVVDGARRSDPGSEPKLEVGPDRAQLRRELSAAEVRERKAEAAVRRERERIGELDRKRSEARDRLRAAEAEHRGASLERKRLAATLARSEARR